MRILGKSLNEIAMEQTTASGSRPPYSGVSHDMIPAGKGEAARMIVNPQLGPEPCFTYPTPTDEQLADGLPPYFENENVGLGVILERLTRRAYGDLRGLLEHT